MSETQFRTITLCGVGVAVVVSGLALLISISTAGTPRHIVAEQVDANQIRMVGSNGQPLVEIGPVGDAGLSTGIVLRDLSGEKRAALSVQNASPNMAQLSLCDSNGEPLIWGHASGESGFVIATNLVADHVTEGR